MKSREHSGIKRQPSLSFYGHQSRVSRLPVVKALKLAVSTSRHVPPLVHHSDRDIQSCSAEYQAIHQLHQITCLMTDGYDCYQNALAERVSGILKGKFY